MYIPLEKINLRTLDIRDVPSAGIEKQSQENWQVKVDAKNVSSEGSAKANTIINISQTLNEGATGEGWW